MKIPGSTGTRKHALIMINRKINDKEDNIE